MAEMALLLIMAVFALAQNPASQTPKSKRFYWSVGKAHELDYKKTIRNSPELNPDERAALLKAVAALIRPLMDDLKIGSERERLKIAEDTRIKMVDLNGDGIPEVIAQAVGFNEGCGATGNCSIWIFMKTENGYKLLSVDHEMLGQLITVENTHSNGFNDLVIAFHDSAS
ncbi:MAG: hypothetical protein WB424_16785 [Terracidiphilus sp.]